MHSTLTRCIFPLAAAMVMTGAANAQRVVPLDPRMESLVPKETKIEKIAEGFRWVEGPVWDRKQNRLLFSDIPANTAWQWTRENGQSIFLKPSGHTGLAPASGIEHGSNGLAFDHQGRLLLCDQGDRRVSRIEEDGSRITLADRYDGKRLNSPNDLVVLKNGDILFTDPPYGLPKGWKSPLREVDFCGVFRLTPDGKLSLLTKEIPAPNGIHVSPDETTLYVTNSQRERAQVLAFPINSDASLGPMKVLFDATSQTEGTHGTPDGLKVDTNGNLFVTAPGGVFVLTPDGIQLGTIEFDKATSNCGWGEDGSTLFVTASNEVYRIPTLTKAAGW